jgi:hypothetical protein
MTDDVRKLLGGYATGTLTEEEKQVLYDAALQDNELFAALADEQALKELLDDSAVRAQLLRATEEPRFSFGVAFREWFDRPKAKALVATAAVLVAIIGFQTTRQELEQKEEQIAEVRPSALEAPPPPPAVEPQSKPAPEPVRKAVKPKQEARNSIVVPPPPPPARAAQEMSRDAAAGGVVGGIVGGVPSGAMARFKAATSEQAPPLRYELLLRGPDGEFHVVPSDHQFTPGDLVRIRVTSTQNGAIAVATTGATLSGTVIANQATTIPATGGIAITPETGSLILKFADSDTTKSVEVPIRRRP